MDWRAAIGGALGLLTPSGGGGGGNVAVATATNTTTVSVGDQGLTTKQLVIAGAVVLAVVILLGRKR